MKFTEVLREGWFMLSLGQRVTGLLIGLLLIFVMFSGWFDSCSTRSEIRKLEREAAVAKRDKDEALAAAAKIATQIKVREQELAKVEVKRDEKRGEVKSAEEQVARDRADYERAVRERVPDAPSTDQLCAGLAAVGHPCQPR